MPKPQLQENDAKLEADLIDTLLAGLHEWRSDLSYPQSHSDMQACVRGILKMFEIKRRPLVSTLRIRCHVCEGIGHFIEPGDGFRQLTECKQCKGKGWFPG